MTELEAIMSARPGADALILTIAVLLVTILFTPYRAYRIHKVFTGLVADGKSISVSRFAANTTKPG